MSHPEQHGKPHGASHVPLTDETAAQATQYTSQEAHFFSPDAQRMMKKHSCDVLMNVLFRGEAAGSSSGAGIGIGTGTGVLSESKTESVTHVKDKTPYAVIVLGAGVGPWLEPLWTGATIRICADGGANHVYQHLSSDTRQRFLPHAIIGNMQKVREETITFYQQHHSVKIVKDGDTSVTDATKCCMYLRDMLSTGEAFSQINSIVCYGAFGGRLDHELGNLDTLVRITTQIPDMVSRVIMLSEGNLAEYLTAGYHLIECCPTLEGIGTRCGIFPLGKAVRECYTMGLKYNIDGESLAFGELISVSNQICAQQVRIRVSEGVIWTTECEAVYPTGHEQESRAKSRRMREEAKHESGQKSEAKPAAKTGITEDPKHAKHQVSHAYHA